MEDIDRLADAARRAFLSEPNDTTVGSRENVYPGTKNAWRAAARALVAEITEPPIPPDPGWDEYLLARIAKRVQDLSEGPDEQLEKTVSETEKPLTESQQAVLRTVERQECPTASEVAEVLRISPTSARTALTALARRGLVRRGGTASGGGTAWLPGTPAV